MDCCRRKSYLMILLVAMSFAMVARATEPLDRAAPTQAAIVQAAVDKWRKGSRGHAGGLAPFVWLACVTAADFLAFVARRDSMIEKHAPSITTSEPTHQSTMKAVSPPRPTYTVGERHGGGSISSSSLSLRDFASSLS